MIAADRREFSGFPDVRPIPTRARWSAEVRFQGRRCVLLANGVGRQNAAQAADWACRKLNVELIVSTGYAGAITPKLQMGNILVVSLVRQHEGCLEYPVNVPVYPPAEGVSTGSLLTIDQIAQSADEKSRLALTGFDAVDMEASAVAAIAKERGIPFVCIRTISDDAQTDLEIDFNRARRPDGTISGWHVLGQVIRKPRLWLRLDELRRNAQEASRRLGEFLAQCKFPSQTI